MRPGADYDETAAGSQREEGVASFDGYGAAEEGSYVFQYVFQVKLI